MNMMLAICLAFCLLMMPRNGIAQEKDQGFAYDEGYSISWDEYSIEITLDGTEIPKRITDKLIARFRNTDAVAVSFEETRFAITDKDLKWISAISAISEITSDVTIGKNAAISPNGFGMLSQLTNLQNLEIKVSSFEGISKLATLKKLKEISLAYSMFSNTHSIIEFESLRNLKHLNLAQTNVDDRVLGSLQAMTWLKSLKITGTKISPEGVAYLRKRLRSTHIESVPIAILQKTKTVTGARAKTKSTPDKAKGSGALDETDTVKRDVLPE